MIELRGGPVAQQVYTELSAQIGHLSRKPQLRVVRLGDDPASVSYVNLKDRRAKELGLLSQVHVLPITTTQMELLALIEELNQDPKVDGILVQLPLPAHIQAHAVLEAILPEKDVDGFHPVNIGRLWMGEASLPPCTPAGIVRLLKHYEVSLRQRVVIVGRSNIVGKPLAALLLQEDATVSVAHSKTPNIAQITREADILVVAVGRPGLVTPDMIRPGAVVVDVGVNRKDGKLVGDVDAGVALVAKALTPVPGGVGPMTVAMLLANTVRAAVQRRHA